MENEFVDEKVITDKRLKGVKNLNFRKEKTSTIDPAEDLDFFNAAKKSSDEDTIPTTPT